MPASPLHQRLRLAVGRRTFRDLAALTDSHPETVRRYVLGQSPSAEFLQRIAEGLEINTEWLLQGRGPMRRNEIRQHALREANAHELLTAVADSLEKLIDRVDRIEVFLHTLESRLRVAGTPSEPNAQGSQIEIKPPSLGDDTRIGVNLVDGTPSTEAQTDPSRDGKHHTGIPVPRVIDITKGIRRHDAGPARPSPDSTPPPSGA